MSNNPFEEKKTDEPVESETAKSDSADKSNASGSKQQKYNIPQFPKPKELTPEQKLEKEKDRRRRRRKRKLKTKIRHSLFGIAIISLLAVLFYFTIAKKEKKELPDNAGVVVPATVSDFESVLASTDSSEIIRFSNSLHVNLVKQSLPNKITRLKELLQLGQRLVDLDADDNSRKYGVGVLLDSLIFLDTLNLAYELKDPGVRGQLVELAQDKLNDEDMAIRRKAHLGMCLSLTHDYSIDPTDEKFAKVLDQFKLSVPTLSDDVPSVVSLGRLIELVKNSPRQDHVVELMNVAGAEFKKSNIEMVRSVGAKFHDDIVLGEFDFAAIGEQMLMGDEESLKRLALAMDVVTRNPQISGIAFSKVLSLTDNLSQIGKEELELEYVKRLRDASNNVTDEDLSAGIQEVWANYDKRNALSGKTFDLTADQLHGQPLDMERLKGKIVAVIFFGQRHGKSLDLIARLHDYEYLISEGVEFVLCSIDEHPKPELLSPLTKVRGINLVTKFGARAYREQCPVSKVPYTLILNRQHTVVATNIHEDDLRTRLEQLVKAGE